MNQVFLSHGRQVMAWVGAGTWVTACEILILVVLLIVVMLRDCPGPPTGVVA